MEATASLKAVSTLRDLYHDIRCAMGDDWREEEQEEEWPIPPRPR